MRIPGSRSATPPAATPPAAARPGRRLWLGPWLLAACLACSQRTEDPRVLRLLQATPEDGASGVFLNEAVELFFSEDLDPASLHAQSARISSRDGAPARGSWELTGRRLVFTPDPVLASDLSDGGWRPGERYEAELSGFPRPDGLRGASGAPLARTLRWRFQVVEVEEPRRGFVFADASLDRGLPLTLRSRTVPPAGPIVLEGEEPIDPSSLVGDDFALLEVYEGRDDGRTVLTPGERIPVRARLAENFDKRAPRPRGTTLIELYPERRLEPEPSPGAAAGRRVRYHLQMRSGARLRDFGGHSVPFLPTLQGQRLFLEVRESAEVESDVHFEPFLGIENRSLEAVAGTDGTAWWGTSGRVEVRLPAAVGTGADGEVQLAGLQTDRDVHAVRLLVEPAAEAELPGGPGAVVLRAQGSLRVEGVLARRGSTDAGAGLVFQPGESLSSWLARALAEGSSVTVLLAGGDLVVTGGIEVDGPLLLVAGGRLRLGGQDWIRATELYTLGEGGAYHSYLDPRTDLPERALAAPLALDLARSNPLAQHLTFAIRSGPIPRQGRVARWHDLPRVGGHAGSGAFRVLYVGQPSASGPGGRTEMVVKDPVQLSDCPNLRLQVELDVHPGVPWDPPWVDFAEVAWEPAGAEHGR